MKRKMISVSTALALMLSVAGCKDKAPEETTPETTTPTTAIEASSAEAGSAPTAETEPDSQEYPGTTEVPQTASETAEPKTIFRTLPLSAKPEVLQAEFGTDIVLRVDFAEADDTYYRWQCRKGTDPWEDSYWKDRGRTPLRFLWSIDLTDICFVAHLKTTAETCNTQRLYI
jgi:hypothetical protein